MPRSHRSYSASNMLLQCASSAAQYSLPAESSAWSFFTRSSRRRISLRSFCVSACGAETRTEASACGAEARGGCDAAGVVGATGLATAGTTTGADGGEGGCDGNSCGGAAGAGEDDSRFTRGAGGGGAAGATTGADIGRATGAEGAKKSPRTSETPRDTGKGEGETSSSTSGAAAGFGFIRFFTRVTRSCGWKGFRMSSSAFTVVAFSATDWLTMPDIKITGVFASCSCCLINRQTS